MHLRKRNRKVKDFVGSSMGDMGCQVYN